MPRKNKTIKKTKRAAESPATPTAIEAGSPPAGSESQSQSQSDPNEQEADQILLSPEEELFVTYLFEENMNRTQAYLRGHPANTVDSARASASRMLARVNVTAEVARRMKDEAMSEEEGILRLSRVARGTLTPFLKQGPDGFMYFDMSHQDAAANMYLIREMETKRERRLVGSGEAAEEWEGEWVKVKLHDAYAATVDLLKIYGKFTKKIDLTTGGEPLPAAQSVTIYIPSNNRDDNSRT